MKAKTCGFIMGGNTISHLTAREINEKIIKKN